MDTVVDIVFSILVLMAGTWVVIFGGVGALLSSTREGSWALGLALGIFLGPIGWGVTLYQTRASRRIMRPSEFIAQLAEHEPSSLPDLSSVQRDHLL